jgi:hypothetical protein
MTIYELFEYTENTAAEKDFFSDYNFHTTGYIRIKGENAVKFIADLEEHPDHCGIYYEDGVEKDHITAMPCGIDVGIEDYGYGRVAIVVHEPITADYLR